MTPTPGHPDVPESRLARLLSAFSAFRHFSGVYRLQTALVIALLVGAGLAEGVSIVALLPLIGVAVGKDTSELSGLSQRIEGYLGMVGIEPVLEHLLGLVVVLIVVKSLFLLVAMRKVGFTGAQVARDLRVRFLRALMSARWEHLLDQKAGDLTTSVLGETNRTVSNYMVTCQIITFGIQVVVYLVVSLFISAFITIAAIVVGLASNWLLGDFIRISRETGKQQTTQRRIFMSRLLDGLACIKMIKAMGHERTFVPLLEGDVGELMRNQKRQVGSRQGLTQLQDPIRVIALATGLYLLLTYWEGGVESIFVLIVLFSRTIHAIGALQSQYQTVVNSAPAFHFVMETIQSAEQAREHLGGAAQAELRHGIEFRDVSFAYKDLPVLQHTNLQIPARGLVAFIGPSGSGKTTLADLCIGLIRPSSGDILVDGVALRDLDIARWRRCIGYVPQETTLFHDTIRQNVTLGDPALDDAQVETALRRAGALSFVTAFPAGLDTVVGERGGKLSGGQRQRISVARALARNPSLLILDEATSGLDRETEVDLCETLAALSDEVCVLAISHQPAILEWADVVFRVEQGQVSVEVPASVNSL